MICQQITPEQLITTQNGCKRIRAASDIRNDCVSKRMKLMADESNFVYHVSNECYKTYTNANLLRRIQKREKCTKHRNHQKKLTVHLGLRFVRIVLNVHRQIQQMRAVLNTL